jgi:hypothetical protein
MAKATPRTPHSPKRRTDTRDRRAAPAPRLVVALEVQPEAPTPLPRVDAASMATQDTPFDAVVYIDHDASGSATPQAYAAQHPRAFSVRVGGQEFVHTQTHADGTWIYYPRT